MSEVQHYEATVIPTIEAADLEKTLGLEVETEELTEFVGDREVNCGTRYLVGLPVGSQEWTELQRTGYLDLSRGNARVVIEL
jgi:hypothetical protein